MDRLTLERRQVGLYLVAIALGLGAGSLLPAVAPWFAALLWPTLMLLLYVTFVQVPLLHLRAAFADRCFIALILLGNFVLLPLAVWGMLAWLPDDPALRLGVLLVLLVPCTDWFITFSQLGGGDVPRAIAVTPLNLALQLLLLPFYLWGMADGGVSAAFTFAQVWPALLVVLLPLALAALTERWAEAKRERHVLRTRLAWWPVPLLALVVFLIAGAQVQTVMATPGRLLAVLPVFVAFLVLAALLALVVFLIAGAQVQTVMATPGWLLAVLPVFVAFLVLAALLAKALAALWRLPAAQGRTLAFSLGTRNSFVVLPFALTLPAGWEIAAAVIVLQSLVELFGMAVYLSWLPQRLFAD